MVRVQSIRYRDVSPKQKEIYDFQKIADILADYDLTVSNCRMTG